MFFSLPLLQITADNKSCFLLHFQIQPRSKKQRSTSDTVTAEGPRQSLRSHSTPTDEADTLLWDPEEDLWGAGGDEIVVIKWNDVTHEDVTQVM